MAKGHALKILQEAGQTCRADTAIPGLGVLLLMISILHDLKGLKLWELWYIPYYGQCRTYIINRRSFCVHGSSPKADAGCTSESGLKSFGVRVQGLMGLRAVLALGFRVHGPRPKRQSIHRQAELFTKCSGSRVLKFRAQGSGQSALGLGFQCWGIPRLGASTAGVRDIRG